MENWMTLGHFHCRKGSDFFFFYWNRTFQYEFVSPAQKFSTKSTIHELSDAFNHCHGNSHSIALDLGTTFTRSKIGDWLMLVEFTDLILFSTTGTQMT